MKHFRYGLFCIPIISRFFMGLFRACHKLLIHSANPKSRQLGIIVFARTCPSVCPSPLFKSSKKQQKTMFATGVTMGLAEWIIDDTCFVHVMLREFSYNFINSFSLVYHLNLAAWISCDLCLLNVPYVNLLRSEKLCS